MTRRDVTVLAKHGERPDSLHTRCVHRHQDHAVLDVPVKFRMYFFASLKNAVFVFSFHCKPNVITRLIGVVAISLNSQSPPTHEPEVISVQ